MLTDRLQNFYRSVHTAIAEVGNSATKVADRVIREAFPDTAEAAEREGADRMLRNGVVAHIAGYLKRQDGNPVADQIDFDEIAPDFRGIVSRLSNPTHYVPSLEEYVPVRLLIANPCHLDEARKFKRQKGFETLGEADVLDELYDAIADIGQAA